jgi:hypothetical protein
LSPRIETAYSRPHSDAGDHRSVWNVGIFGLEYPGRMEIEKHAIPGSMRPAGGPP